MSLGGTSIIVGRVAVGLSTFLACVYVYRFVHLAHGTARATAALLIFGLTPMTFKFSHYVMLEMPTLALSLAAAFHFWRYLQTTRRRDVFYAATLAALAALSAIIVLPSPWSQLIA